MKRSSKSNQPFAHDFLLAVLMTEMSSSHVGEERAFHAAPKFLQPGSMQDSIDDFTTAEVLEFFLVS